MNLYLSSFTAKHLEAYIAFFPKEKLNILVSYGLRNKSIAAFLFKYANNINSLILDSGTFTLNFAQKKATREKIDFTGYRAFLRELGHLFDYVFNFDSEFDEYGQVQNDRHMDILLGDGHKVVPVVHTYTEREVSHYLKQNHPIIALGYSKDKSKANIEKCCNQIHDAGAKAHVLGVSTWNRLAHTPVAYCDSSSWVQHGMYGCIQYWNESRKVKPDSDKTDSIRFLDTISAKKTDKPYYHNYDYLDELDSWIKETFGWEDYVLPNIENKDKRTLVNIHYFVQLQKRITEHHAKLGFNT